MRVCVYACTLGEYLQIVKRFEQDLPGYQRYIKIMYYYYYLASLHWLPVESRIKYKLSVICHNCLFNKKNLPYFSNLLSLYTPGRQLRSSSDTSVLRRPSAPIRSFGQRSFSHSGPSAWNDLPFTVRNTESLPAFKSALKTFLYKKIFLRRILSPLLLFSPTDCFACVCAGVCARCACLVISMYYNYVCWCC